MSCIPRLLKLKGDKEFLPINSGSAIERGGHYSGYDWCVTITEHGTRCGYVAIDPKHPLHGNYDDEYDIYCHGGVTFYDSPNHILDENIVGRETCGDKWIGFDAAHWTDGKDMETAIRALPNSNAKELVTLYNECCITAYRSYPARNADYMENECKDIIDQLTGISE